MHVLVTVNSGDLAKLLVQTKVLPGGRKIFWEVTHADNTATSVAHFRCIWFTDSGFHFTARFQCYKWMLYLKMICVMAADMAMMVIIIIQKICITFWQRMNSMLIHICNYLLSSVYVLCAGTSCNYISNNMKVTSAYQSMNNACFRGADIYYQKQRGNQFQVCINECRKLKLNPALVMSRKSNTPSVINVGTLNTKMAYCNLAASCSVEMHMQNRA